MATAGLLAAILVIVIVVFALGVYLGHKGTYTRGWHDGFDRAHNTTTAPITPAAHRRYGCTAQTCAVVYDHERGGL